MKLEPCIVFTGNCEEALNFYKKCLKGQITSINYFKDAQIQIDENYRNKVVNASFRFGNCEFCACDTLPDTNINIGNNISLSIETENLEDAEQYFKNLSTGGKISLPLQETFWGTRFGILTDKYGINWMFNCRI